jgi:uncharacterized membrane protein YkvA (DUF1232 family)
MKLNRRTESKRITSHQRNKVFKKTKEHHKKMKKIAKRNPQLRKSEKLSLTFRTQKGSWYSKLVAIQTRIT